MRLQAIEYLNISGLLIDFATSPVRTGNSFFGVEEFRQPLPGKFFAFLTRIFRRIP